MSGPAGTSPTNGGVSPALAAFLSVGGFGALSICGFGFLSLLTGSDVVPSERIGHLPGPVGFAVAVAALSLVLLDGLRRPRPSYVLAVPAALAVFAAYPAGLAVASVLGGVDPVFAATAAAQFAGSWYAVVLAAAAAAAGWVAVALVRTRARRPEWPWEHDDEE